MEYPHKSSMTNVRACNAHDETNVIFYYCVIVIPTKSTNMIIMIRILTFQRQNKNWTLASIANIKDVAHDYSSVKGTRHQKGSSTMKKS